MERIVTIDEAKEVFGKYFIGQQELLFCADKLGISIPDEIPLIHYTRDVLLSSAKDFILILGVPSMKNGEGISLLSLRQFFGVNPEKSEPCFYNQDWYLEESFMKNTLECRWYLIRRTLFENSRSVSPDILSKQFIFPSAILSAYTFFMVWHCISECLWCNEFIWCNDCDHNSDRIYVGKYKDIDSFNKNGFSIHRHLALRNCYGSISIL